MVPTLTFYSLANEEEQIGPIFARGTGGQDTFKGGSG